MIEPQIRGRNLGSNTEIGGVAERSLTNSQFSANGVDALEGPLRILAEADVLPHVLL